MKPFTPDSLPLDRVDWAAHVSLIGQANAALARRGKALCKVDEQQTVLCKV